MSKPGLEPVGGEACKCETCECQSPVFLNWECPEFQSSEVQRCTGSQFSKCKVFNMHRWVAGWVVGWLVGWWRYTITNVSGETENRRRFLCLWGHWLRLHVASKAHACYGAVSFGAVGRGFESHRARQGMKLRIIPFIQFLPTMHINMNSHAY